ncbi:MAG: 4Fe-4S binding protein [Spirochaetes bacterium]|nr:4Fe-4S binding protein [Spirochaetota bacterium]
MTKTKCKVIINADLCKGCSLCVEHCKRGVLCMSGDLNVQGYNYAVADESKECTGCLVCTLVCPEVAIEVQSD